MLFRGHRAHMLRAVALLFTCSCSVYDDRLTLREMGSAPTGSVQTPQSIAPGPTPQAGMTASVQQPSAAQTASSTRAGAPARAQPQTEDDAGVPPVPVAGTGAGTTPPRSTGADHCPDDPLKLEPGVCGCGVPDVDTAAAASCSGLRAALRHRYPFDGTANVARDVRAQADAVIEGASLRGDGSVQLQDSTARQYVALPAGLLSQLQSVTIEVWLQSDRAGTSETIFDLTDLTPSAPLPPRPAFPPPLPPLPVSRSALSLRTQLGVPRAAVVLPGLPSVAVSAGEALTTGRTVHLAVVVDGAQQRLALFIDGKLIGDTSLTTPLSQVHDTTNWLGSSPAAPEVTFTGSFYELRIYDRALTPQQIATSWNSGPNPEYLRD